MNIISAACAVAAAICLAATVACDYRAHRQRSDAYVPPRLGARLNLPLRAFSAAGVKLKSAAYCWRAAMIAFMLLAWAAGRP